MKLVAEFSMSTIEQKLSLKQIATIIVDKGLDELHNYDLSLFQDVSAQASAPKLTVVSFSAS